jgi:hypothetical protein
MAYIKFTKVADFCNCGNITVRQTMTCMNYKSILHSEFLAGFQYGKLPPDCSGTPGGCVHTGVQLDCVASGPGRGDNLLFVGRDKSAHQNAFFMHSLNNFGKSFFVPDAIQPPFRSQLGPILRHKSNLVRPDLFRDFNDSLGHAHFEIQLAGNRFFQSPNVSVADMPSVLAQVNGNSVRTGQFALDGRPDRVRLIGQTGLPDCRNVVYIHIQHRHFLALVFFRIISMCGFNTSKLRR